MVEVHGATPLIGQRGAVTLLDHFIFIGVVRAELTTSRNEILGDGAKPEPEYLP